MGAAFSDDVAILTYDEIINRLNTCEKISRETNIVPFTLFKDETEYEEFKQRHNKDIVKKASLNEYKGPLIYRLLMLVPLQQNSLRLDKIKKFFILPMVVIMVHHSKPY